MNRLAKLIKEAQELNNELTAVLTMLNRYTEPEDERLPPVLIYRDGDFVRAETDEEIALRKIEEYIKEHPMTTGYLRMLLQDIIDWLQQDGK